MKSTITTLTALLWALQTHYLYAQQLIFKSYTIQDGLAANHINCIKQDSTGFMWFGTGEGLSKYDGHRFTNYSTLNGLGFNYINDIFEIAPNRLLIAENNGTTDVMEHGEIIHHLQIRDAIVGRMRLLPQGKLIAVTDDKGICVLTNNQWIGSSVNNYATEMALLADSLIATTGEGNPLVIVHAGSLSTVATLPAKRYNFTTLFTDKQQRTWIGTNRSGLLVLKAVNGVTQGFIPVEPPETFRLPFLAKTVVKCMLQDDKNAFWIGTADGLLWIQPDGKQQVFTKQHGLPSNIIFCLFQDREKNIWAGTREGLCKIVTINNVQLFEASQESGSYASQQLWKQSEKKLFAFTGRAMKTINTDTWQINDWPGPVITQNGAYFPGRTTLFVYQPPKSNTGFTQKQLAGSAFTDGINLPLFGCAAMNKWGNKYYGTSYGIIVCHPNQPTDTLLRTTITSLNIDNYDNLWAGTWHRGLYRIQQKNGESITDDMSHVLPDKSIRTTFEDRAGNLWIGLRNEGLVVLQQYDTARANVIHFNKRTGLSSDWVKCITQDGEGNIWIGTNQGLDKLIPDRQGFRIYNFSRINNFTPTIYGIVSLANNVLWCLSSIGLIRIEDIHLDTVAPYTPIITSIVPGTSKISLSWKQLQSNLSLKYSDNSIRFEFAVPSFINEKHICFSYRLLGSNDTSWSTPAVEHTVAYASMQAGYYSFEVRSLGWNNQWSAPTGYSFRIRPPFWKTWWFLLAAVACMVAALYAFYRYRLSQALKLQAVRNRIATDLHDEIGSTLTNISILSELSSQNLQQSDTAQKFLGRISEEVVSTSQALDDIIWSVNTGNDSFEELMRRMRRYAGELFDVSRISYDLQFDKDLAGVKLHMELRRDMYLIFKEALNNIHKHAAATHVQLELSRQGNIVVILIADDGKGFTRTETHRNGLKNMQYRAGKWAGSLIIDSAPGNGTKITVSFPLKH